MEYKCSMLVVTDIEKTKAFYTSLMGLTIVGDLGVNVVFSGGLVAQTAESWATFTGSDSGIFKYGGNDMELYFEEADFDGFRAKAIDAGAEVLSETVMPWGQKVLRFYDPDKHIVEVGEDMGVMIRRLHADGLTVEQLSERSSMLPEVIEQILKG